MIEPRERTSSINLPSLRCRYSSFSVARASSRILYREPAFRILQWTTNSFDVRSSLARRCCELARRVKYIVPPFLGDWRVINKPQYILFFSLFVVLLEPARVKVNSESSNHPFSYVIVACSNVAALPFDNLHCFVRTSVFVVSANFASESSSSTHLFSLPVVF